MDKKLIAEVLSAFVPDNPNQHHLRDMNPTDDLAQRGFVFEQAFTAGVDTLRRFQNAAISDLMSYVWDIYHYNHVMMALGPNIPSLSIAVTGTKGNLRALTFVPHNWAEMIKEDPVMQLGAVLFVGSQATDFYNNRFATKEESLLSRVRATSYEAEYLRLIQDSSKLNDYQQSVLAKYPNGFDTSLTYTRRPVLPKT
jgi:hypothetical protein